LLVPLMPAFREFDRGVVSVHLNR